MAIERLIELENCPFISDVSLNMYGRYLLNAFVVNDVEVITAAATAIGRSSCSKLVTRIRPPGSARHGPNDRKVCCDASRQGSRVAGAQYVVLAHLASTCTAFPRLPTFPWFVVPNCPAATVRSELKRHAAALILEELARTQPQFLYPYIPRIFSSIFAVIQEQKVPHYHT